MEFIIEILKKEGFLIDMNTSFATIEVSILATFLVFTSIYQVVLSNLVKNLNLEERLSLINITRILKRLRLVTIIIVFPCFISILASIFNLLILDVLSLLCFSYVVVRFAILIIILIDNILSESEKLEK